MSREIKFRVWNQQDNCWDNPNLLEVWNDSGKLEPFQFVKSGTLKPLYIPKENYIIQQFTGIKDKNGKEIYEGDVVKVQRGFVKPYVKDGKLDYKYLEGGLEIGEVVWGTDAEFLVSYKRHDDLENIKNIPYQYEVIGNIFENQDLLKNI